MTAHVGRPPDAEGSSELVPPPARVMPGAVGILGGTFDPIHIGHLALADEARETLGLERVLFVPAPAPPHKLDRAITPIADRVAMVELAITGQPSFAISLVELERSGPSFTVDTLDELRRVAGEAREPFEPTLILSVESLAELPTWREHRRIVELARVAVAPRDDRPMPDRAWLDRHLPGLEDRIVPLGGPNLSISASGIRARVRAGRSVRYLVPLAVNAYIADHGLYT